MKVQLALLTSLIAGCIAQAAPLVTSSNSGPWSAGQTWQGGKPPSAGAKVLIRAGHTVVYDVKSQDVLRSLHIGGTLTFAPDRDTQLNVGLIKIQHGDSTEENGFDCAPHPKDAGKVGSGSGQPGFSAACLCCDGKPALLVGTPERPIDAKHTAVIRLHYVSGMDRESCPAIVCCGGRLDFHGAPLSRTWVKLGDTARKAANHITLAEAIGGWRVGDRIIVTTSGSPQYKSSDTEEATIKSIAGTELTLEQPLAHEHVGTGEYRAEVANLSRNVVVESADPSGPRGHTMYHRKSAGSISYAEFRHLGKEGVLGKYSLHYHLCGDTMRGSSVVGASIHHSQNRWLTIHGTNYLVVRDCVGYRSIGHGYFLEDGTEVYNVFDRNLACQALEGKPLPKQVLPFDKNDGAGFWFANSHNTFTRNVGVQCGQYGFRFDAAPKAGVVVEKTTYGEPKRKFDLVMSVRQPDGSEKAQDIRTLPFVRFEDNESHSNGKWGLNLGQGAGEVGPEASTPFVIRNLKIWSVVGGFGVEVPHVLIDGMTIHNAAYGVRESVYRGQDYRRVVIQSRNLPPVGTLEEYRGQGNSGPGHNRVRQPGWPMGKGDGGPRFQDAAIETAKLTPLDKLPPITVITQVRRDGSRLIVRGTTTDDGAVKKVSVNDVTATALRAGFAEWEAMLENVKPGELTLTAAAVDEAGNGERTPHRLSLAIR